MIKMRSKKKANFRLKHKKLKNFQKYKQIKSNATAKPYLKNNIKYIQRSSRILAIIKYIMN